MQKYHLIGQNIKTSLSPLIHNYLFKLKGINSTYSIYTQNTKPSLQQLIKNKISGLSITIPFKQSYRLQQKLSFTKLHQKMSKGSSILSQRRIINTIRFNHLKNEYQCSNTDIFGIKKCFQNNIKAQQHKNYLACIIGGGATAQTFLAHLIDLNISTIIINRSVDKVQSLKILYKNLKSVFPIHKIIEQKDISSQDLQKHKFNNLILINTLPTSIFRQNFIQEQNFTNLNPNIQKTLKNILIRTIQLNYFDVNYRDHQHYFKKFITKYINNLNANQIKINQIGNGLDMLIWQAIQQNKLFCLQDLCSQTNTYQSNSTLSQEAQYNALKELILSHQ